jgi:ribosome-binding factor A
MALHSRIRRINEELKTVIAGIIMTEVKDPRLARAMVTVNRVGVSKDLHNARVWVSVLGTDEDCAAALEGLNHSRSFIKRLLGERVVLKYVPELRFEFDPSVKEAAHINQILIDLERQRKKSGGGNEPAA